MYPVRGGDHPCSCSFATGLATTAGSQLATTARLATGPVLATGADGLEVLGQRTRWSQIGPQGAYGAVGRGKLAAGVAAAGVAVIALLGAVSDGGGQEGSTAVSLPSSTVSVTVTVTQQATAQPRATITLPPATVTVRPKPLPRATITATVTRPAPIAGTIPPTTDTSEKSSSGVYYDNCTEVRAAGADPIRRGEPGYGPHLDRDGDGVACE